MNNRTLIDSSFLYAAFNEQDRNNQRATDFMAVTKTIPVVPDVILPEVAFLFLRDVGHHAVGRFLEKLAASQTTLQALTLTDLDRAREIIDSYPAAEFDLVDSCIMALAERLQITRVCTFDRRDFSIFRPKHCDYLELLP